MLGFREVEPSLSVRFSPCIKLCKGLPHLAKSHCRHLLSLSPSPSPLDWRAVSTLSPKGPADTSKKVDKALPLRSFLFIKMSCSLVTWLCVPGHHEHFAKLVVFGYLLVTSFYWELNIYFLRRSFYFANHVHIFCLKLKLQHCFAR